MSTDIHGGIEFRHPGFDSDYYDGEPWVAAMDLWSGGLSGATWVSWAELAAMDPTAPAQFTGGLTWRTKSLPSTPCQGVEWTIDDLMCAYEPLTAGTVLGPETHWPHVFAVMKALAGRFGDDGVRLVVAFD
ncbi:hypothetical protein [Streptomyces sp. NPDC005538]|uniref:hypothetical protein n=1 Tax=unclassified Streptomyces TaxID=2593676 RepID=UPI0033ABFD1D